MEERLIFDAKDVVLRIVCQNCGTACVVAPADWVGNIGSCLNCQQAWKGAPEIFQDLARPLKALAQQDQQQAGGFAVQFEVPVGARAHGRAEVPVVAPGSLPSSR